jgi:cysteine desulfurase
MRSPVYLDNHATTPVDPRVLEAMLPYFGPKFGNAASRSHPFGWEAEKAVDLARRRIAELAGAQPREIIFTSGATESNNLALKGVAEANGARGRHIVTMLTEHRAVLDPLHRLERLGYEVTFLPPRPDGLLDLDQFRAALRSDTILASIMYANNEIGVIQPVVEIGAVCREHGVVFHCDAAQAFGKVPVSVDHDSIDVMSLSAHKIYGPKGVGAVYVRRGKPRVEIAPQIDGGGHEQGLRSGTLNVPGIVGFGKACSLCAEEMEPEAARLRTLRDFLKLRITSAIDNVRVNGSMEHRLPGNLNLSFPGVNADALVTALPDVALSTGSACSSASVEPSHVLKAIAPGFERSSIRFGLGRFTTEEEIEYAAARVISVTGAITSKFVRQPTAG